MIEAWPESLAACGRAEKSLVAGVSAGMLASMRPHPLFFEGGSGPRPPTWPANTCLDHILGWRPVTFGHGHPELAAPVAARIGLGATFDAGHLLEYEAAERDHVSGAETCRIIGLC